MLFEVREHVNQRIANRARTLQRATVPPIRKEPASPREQPIHAPCDADAQAAHPFDQRLVISRLDDEVEMIALHREVDDAKPYRSATIRGANRAMDSRIDELTPK